MALDTYTALVNSLPVWLHRQGDSEVMAAVPDMVALAESEINVKLRTRYQEARFSEVILVNQDNAGAPISTSFEEGRIRIPEDYTDLKYAYIATQPVSNLTRKSPDWILSQYPYRELSSRPEFIARDIDEFIFGPYPDSEYVVNGVYYKAMPPLSEENPSNALLARYPKAFLFGALSQAEKFIRNDPSIDQMMIVWKGEFAQAMQEAQDETDREAMSGGRARMSIVGSTP